MKHKESSSCRVCGRAVEPAAESRGSEWALCAIHAFIATEPPHHRLAMTEIIDELRRDRLRIVLDANGAGWLRKVEPQPPKPQAVEYDDLGRPRYRDLSSPTGVTWYPGDIVQGGTDPKLDRFRTPADGDDDAQPKPRMAPGGYACQRYSRAMRGKKQRSMSALAGAHITRARETQSEVPKMKASRSTLAAANITWTRAT